MLGPGSCALWPPLLSLLLAPLRSPQRKTLPVRPAALLPQNCQVELLPAHLCHMDIWQGVKMEGLNKGISEKGYLEENTFFGDLTFPCSFFFIWFFDTPSSQLKKLRKAYASMAMPITIKNIWRLFERWKMLSWVALSVSDCTVHLCVCLPFQSLY